MTKYNVRDYISTLQEGKKMTFESVFEAFQKMNAITLERDKDPSIQLIEEEPFYITPSFLDVSSKKDAVIYVISAPGATGKSALAKHLAYTFGALYWNLADIMLGDNSFIGTLVRSIGSSHYSEYINDLLTGKALLVIDAFDEAEMISGTKAVRNFLADISKNVSNAQAPCIILLSRAETAQEICACLTTISARFNQYEISFFEDEKSAEFVKKVVDRDQANPQNPEIIDKCISQYLCNINRLVTSEERSSFIGYAPVLEVIGKHIARENNAYSFLNTLQSANMKGIDVIDKIMEELLLREQEKVREGFIKRIFSSYDREKIDEESIYSPIEQMVLIVSYILFESYDPSFYDNSAIPYEVRDQYNDIITSFLPQHPFLRTAKGNSVYEFTGPAFRDYIIAKMIDVPEKNELLLMFISEKRISNHFPSHLLWNFYTNKADIVIPSNLLSYFFDSYRSQTKAADQAFLTIAGNKKVGYSSEWAILSHKGTNVNNENYEILINDEKLSFESLINVSIDLDDLPVTVENASANVQITRSSVVCTSLTIKSDRIVFDAYDDTPCTLISKENATIKNSSGVIPEIILNGDNISIDFPNVKQYFRLIKYRKQFSEDSPFSIELFAYILRKIFVQFRKHRKDTPARDAEKIDFLIVGNETNRRSVFNYLTKRNVIYREEPLYKINMNNLESLGISWMAVTSGDLKQLHSAYKSFLEWLNESK